MKKKEFNEKLSRINLTQKDFAQMVGYSYQAVKQWKDDKIPKWAGIVLEYFEELYIKKEKYAEYSSIKDT